jgi:hypothetical protein
MDNEVSAQSCKNKEKFNITQIILPVNNVMLPPVYIRNCIQTAIKILKAMKIKIGSLIGQNRRA